MFGHVFDGTRFVNSRLVRSGRARATHLAAARPSRPAGARWSAGARRSAGARQSAGARLRAGARRRAGGTAGHTDVGLHPLDEIRLLSGGRQPCLLERCAQLGDTELLRRAQALLETFSGTM